MSFQKRTVLIIGGFMFLFMFVGSIYFLSRSEEPGTDSTAAVVAASWREFMKMEEAEDRPTYYSLEYEFDTESSKWTYSFTKGPMTRDPNQKKVSIPVKPCNFCIGGIKANFKDAEIMKEANKRDLILLISPNRTILVTPRNCIKFWYDYESKYLDGATEYEKMQSLKELQTSILEMSVIIHREVSKTLNWKSKIFSFCIRVGENDVPHLHFRFSKQLQEKDVPKLLKGFDDI